VALSLKPRHREVDEAEPRWSQVRELAGPAPKSRGRAAATRIAAGLAIAALLLFLGHELAAAMVLAAVTLLSTASFVWPRFDHAVERGARWLSHVVGQVLTFVVLGAVQLLVFTPVAVVSKLLGYDPLARGSSPDDPTFWRTVRPRRRPLHRRQFAYERLEPAARTRPTRAMRVRAAIGLVVIVMVLDVAAGAAVDGVRSAFDRSTAEPLDKPPDVGAARGEPWATELFPAVKYLTDNPVASPYRGWTVRDYSSPYLNERDEVRRSYEPASSTSDGALDVWFLGGSTTWGAYQRDEHTIPSQFARRAEADGLPLRATNYGAPGYAMWQELELLQELLSNGGRPDAVVFYNGVNELYAQSVVGPTDDPTHFHADDFARTFDPDPKGGDESLWNRAYDSYTDKSVLYRAFDEARSLVTDHQTALKFPTIWGPDQTPERAVERARDAVSVHRRGVEIVQHLADAYGFEAFFFWQPTLYTKQIVRGEEDIPGSWAEDPEVWRVLTSEARRHLEAPVIDLSDALDGVREPVMYDFHHTNERGADVMATAMYERAQARLRALSEVSDTER
jgi:hypothetical protein